MIKSKEISVRILFSSVLLLSSAALIAAPHGEGHSEGHGGQGKSHMSMSGKHGSGHSGGHSSGHSKKTAKKGHKGKTFSPHWAKTITDEQKVSFDKMHLQVAQVEAVQRAKMKVLKAELGVMAAKNPPNKNALYAKIDEILSVKKVIMRNRYDHIIEMRAELTDQQRISYDMGLLSPKKHKH